MNNIRAKVGNIPIERASSKKGRSRINPVDEIDALSPRKAEDRLRLAHLAAKARSEVHRSNAIEKLSEIADQVLIDAVGLGLKDKGPLVRMEALEAIATHSLAEFEGQATRCLADNNILVQARAAWALGEIKTASALSAIRRRLPKLRDQALISAEASLYELDHKERHLDAIISFLSHTTPSIRRNASNALVYVATRKHKAKILEAIRDAVKREEVAGVAHDLRKCVRSIQRSLR